VIVRHGSNLGGYTDQRRDDEALCRAQKIGADIKASWIAQWSQEFKWRLAQHAAAIVENELRDLREIRDNVLALRRRQRA
jgi:hypothetical protein